VGVNVSREKWPRMKPTQMAAVQNATFMTNVSGSISQPGPKQPLNPLAGLPGTGGVAIVRPIVREYCAFSCAKPGRGLIGCFFLVNILLLIGAVVASGEEANVRDLMDKMQTAFLKGEYRRALEYNKAALEEEPADLARIIYSRGLIYARLKEDDKAVRDFTEAIQINADLTEAYRDRGLAYVRQGLQAKAMSDYNRVIALEPRNARAYRSRADLEDDLQLWQNAINDYTTAIRYYPDFADALNNRAGVYARLGEHRKAIADYSHCLKLDPKDPDAAWNLGMSYLAIGDSKRAIAAFTRLINFHPNYLPAYSGRALAYLKAGNRPRAVTDARRGIALTPVDDWDFYCRSRLNEFLNDDRSSLRDLREALQRDRSSYLYRNLIAWLLATSPDASLRDGHEAVQLAEQANQSTGWRDSDPIDTLAAAYAEIGDFEKAVEYQERACKMGGVGADRKKRQARLELYRKQKPYRRSQDNSFHEPK
jgi:tetratricopeptide (TPR) repeat protein